MKKRINTDKKLFYKGLISRWRWTLKCFRHFSSNNVKNVCLLYAFCFYSNFKKSQENC